MTKITKTIITIAIFLIPLCYLYPQAYYGVKGISEGDWGIDEVDSPIDDPAIRADSVSLEGESKTIEPINGSRVINATISAYTSSVEETDDTPCENAWGWNICNLHKAGLRIIACPVKYEPSSLVEIEGVIYSCMDRMNQRLHPNDWDLYMGQGEEAYQRAMTWGVRKLPIKIITN